MASDIGSDAPGAQVPAAAVASVEPAASSSSRRATVALGTAYKLIVLGLLICLSVLLICRPLEIFDDLWGHAAIGSWVWEHKAIPDETLFLWSDSIPWVYHHWLSELILYALAALDNEQRLTMTFTVLVGLVPFAVMAWAWTARDWAWVAVPAVFIMDAMATRIKPRPDLFTSVGIAVLLLMIGRFQGRLSWRWIAGFAALFSVWANLHGAVVVGVLLLGATVVCDALQDRWNPRVRALAVLTLVALAAVHVNPYGFGYWRAFTSINGYMFARILEWKPVWEEPLLAREALVGAAVSGAIALSAWGLSPDRRLSQLAWMFLSVGLFLKARRNISVFIVVNGMVTALNARAIEPKRLWDLATRWGRRSDRGQPPCLGLARLGIVCVLAAQVAFFVVRPSQSLPLSLPVLRLERGSVAFLQAHGLNGRVFNDLDSSGYFHWRFQDDLPLFIDGMNAYPDQLMHDYFTILRGDRSSRITIDRYRIDAILLTVNQITSKVLLAKNLDRDPHWARVYADSDAVIWVRRATYPQLIEAVEPVNDVSFATLESFGDFP
jgi:hypothetical protein